MRATRLLMAAFACSAYPAEAPKIAFSALGQATIQQRLESVPRKLSERVARLESLFHQAGCEGDTFREERVPGTKAPNLICTLPGETDDAIVVGGHLDSIDEGAGAVDDWSGSVLLPSLYESLKNRPRHHRYLFVAFAAEERGLVGSSEFVHRLTRPERSRIRAMINLECLGLGEPEVWVSRANKLLLDAFIQVTNTVRIPTRGMNVDGVGDDDSHSFLNAKIPTLTIHSLTRETLPILHSPKDQVSAIHPDDYYASYRLAAAYLSYLDNVLN